MYIDGRGVQQDDVLAYALLEMAATALTDPALRARVTDARARLIGRITATDLATAKAKLEQLRKAAGRPGS